MRVLILIVALTSCLRGASHEDFIKKAIPLAKAVHKKYGIPVSAVVAQAAFESGYGESKLTKLSNNFHGLKASNWTGPTIDYVVTEQGRTHVQTFRRYDSMKAGFLGYAEFLKSKEWYKPCFKQKKGKDFIRSVLAAGYCPDSAYMQGINHIYAEYNLARLDM